MSANDSKRMRDYRIKYRIKALHYLRVRDAAMLEARKLVPMKSLVAEASATVRRARRCNWWYIYYSTLANYSELGVARRKARRVRNAVERARLIEAAPELLRALKLARPYLRRNTPKAIEQRVWDAIENAEQGE